MKGSEAAGDWQKTWTNGSVAEHGDCLCQCLFSQRTGTINGILSPRLSVPPNTYCRSAARTMWIPDPQLCRPIFSLQYAKHIYEEVPKGLDLGGTRNMNASHKTRMHAWASLGWRDRSTLFGGPTVVSRTASGCACAVCLRGTHRLRKSSSLEHSGWMSTARWH